MANKAVDGGVKESQAVLLSQGGFQPSPLTSIQVYVVVESAGSGARFVVT